MSATSLTHEAFQNATDALNEAQGAYLDASENAAATLETRLAVEDSIRKGGDPAILEGAEFEGRPNDKLRDAALREKCAAEFQAEREANTELERKKHAARVAENNLKSLSYRLRLVELGIK